MSAKIVLSATIIRDSSILSCCSVVLTFIQIFVQLKLLLKKLPPNP